MNLHPAAAIALRAVNERHVWGDFAARRFAANRGAASLYRLACQLEAADALPCHIPRGNGITVTREDGRFVIAGRGQKHRISDDSCGDRLIAHCLGFALNVGA